MLRKDFILAEAQKLALVLAKLMGLKQDDKQAEFKQLAENTALKEFDIDWDTLLSFSPGDFETWLERQSFSPDRLDALAQLLYLHGEPFHANPEYVANLGKVLSIYDLLEQKHHRQSLDNINRRKQMELFIAGDL